MADKEHRAPITVLAGDGLLLLCALWGLTASFLSLYSGREVWGVYFSPLNHCAGDGDAFLLCAVVCALLALAVFSLPRHRALAAGGLAALWGLALFACWEDAVRGAGIALREITILFSRRVFWGWEFLYDPGLTGNQEAEAIRRLLLLAIPGLALLLGWAVVRARRWWLVLAFTLPPLLPGLLADLYPDWPAFMALSACWCVMLLTGLCKWAAPTGRGKLTLIVFPCVGLVLLFITVMFPREGYTRPAWALRAQEDLRGLSQRASEFFAQWEGPFGGSVTYVGAAEEADLSNAGPLRFSGRTVLRFITDYDGRLYLRGSSLAVYEDGVWTPLPEGLYEAYYPSDSPPAFPLYFPAMQEQDSPTYTITVNNVGTVGACVYAPYFPVPQVAEDTGALPVDDAYLARKQGQWAHTLDFVERTPPAFSDWDGPYISFDGPSDGQMAANQYAEYAYSHYLDVPEELRDTLNQHVRMWFSTQSSYHSAPGNVAPVQLAQELGMFLSTFCEYDPETPAPPEGVDPVDYFLNESHRGYCMHYASAVALMLRTQGIPARYVSGFTAESVPNRQVDVPDRAAHAWVEVWVDGFGWHPVEVTPAAAFTWYEHGVAGPSELTSYEPVESLPPEPTPTPVPTPAPDASVPPSAGPQLGGADPQGGGGGFTLPPWLIPALAGTAGGIALVWLIQFALKRIRKKRMAGPDPNRAALVCYGYLLRLERRGGRMDPRAVELAQKARFSQHTLTEEELTVLRRLVDRERTRLCVAHALPKRLLYRYFWGKAKPPISLAGDPMEEEP